MSDQQKSNDAVSSLEAWKRALLIGLLGIIGGGAGTWGVGQTGILRPNPFTSIEANALRIELTADRRLEIGRLETSLARLADRLDIIVARLPSSDLADRVRNLEDYHLKTDPNFKRP
ncbi:MAG: hypothetical protein OEM93_10455 [Rhodospirillales bacterium]|nr:hypothetical protein [Rhodospirillales bacterium]MDH3790934.1 hypothetical protein [Rhodospirillales bacterium]